MQAYAGAIENAAPAFDYLGTKGDITATWESAISKDDFRKGVTQIDGQMSEERRGRL